MFKSIQAAFSHFKPWQGEVVASRDLNQFVANRVCDMGYKLNTAQQQTMTMAMETLRADGRGGLPEQRVDAATIYEKFNQQGRRIAFIRVERGTDYLFPALGQIRLVSLTESAGLQTLSREMTVTEFVRQKHPHPWRSFGQRVANDLKAVLR